MKQHVSDLDFFFLKRSVSVIYVAMQEIFVGYYSHQIWIWIIYGPEFGVKLHKSILHVNFFFLSICNLSQIQMEHCLLIRFFLPWINESIHQLICVVFKIISSFIFVCIKIFFWNFFRCYHCNGVGHIAKECTQSQSEPSCYNCNETGHIARNCPKGSSKSCYSCGKTGHLSRDCDQSSDGRRNR